MNTTVFLFSGDVLIRTTIQISFHEDDMSPNKMIFPYRVNKLIVHRTDPMNQDEYLKIAW